MIQMCSFLIGFLDYRCPGVHSNLEALSGNPFKLLHTVLRICEFVSEVYSHQACEGIVDHLKSKFILKEEEKRR